MPAHTLAVLRWDDKSRLPGVAWPSSRWKKSKQVKEAVQGQAEFRGRQRGGAG